MGVNAFRFVWLTALGVVFTVSACSSTPSPADSGDVSQPPVDTLRPDGVSMDAPAADVPDMDAVSSDVAFDAADSSPTDAFLLDSGVTDAPSVDAPNADTITVDVAPDSGARPLFLYTVRGDSIVRFALAAPTVAEVVTSSVGTWVGELSFDTIGDRLYWTDAAANQLRSVARSGTDARLFASTAAYTSLVDRLVVDVPGRAVFFSGNDGATRGPIVRFPIATATPTMIADVNGFNGLSIGAMSRLYGITDGGRCDVDLRVVRLGTAGNDVRQGALSPSVRCAGVRPIGVEESTGHMYFVHKTDFATGSCISGARSCIERVTVSDGAAAGSLVVTGRTSLVSATTGTQVVGGYADLPRGHLYYARATTGASTSFVIHRANLDGTGEVTFTSFMISGAAMYTSFGLPMIVAP